MPNHFQPRTVQMSFDQHFIDAAAGGYVTELSTRISISIDDWACTVMVDMVASTILKKD